MAALLIAPRTCVVSLLRLQSLYAISVSHDISWDNPMAALWSNLEVNIGIMCSCLPMLKALVLRAFPLLFSSTMGTGSGRAVLEIDGHAPRAGRGEQREREDIDLGFVSQGKKPEEIWVGQNAECEGVDHIRIEPGPASEREGDGIWAITVIRQDRTQIKKDEHSQETQRAGSS